MIIEWRKFIKNKVTYLSVGVLLLMVGLAVWTGFNMFQEEYDLSQTLDKGYPDSMALVSPHLFWVGHSDAFFSTFYYFIFPLVVGLPLVDSIHKEMRSGYLNYILVRHHYRGYFVKKLTFTFIISFALFVIPLVIGLILMNILTGTWDYSGFTAAYNKLINGTAVLSDDTGLSQKREMFSDLLQISPYAYMLAYYIIGGLYAGAYSCFGLASSFFFRNRYLILFMPLCLYLGGWLSLSILQLLAWDPFNFLDPRQPVTRINLLPIVIDFVILMALSISLYTFGVRQNRDLLS